MLGEQQKQKGQALRLVGTYFLTVSGQLAHFLPASQARPGCTPPSFSAPVTMLPPAPGRATQGPKSSAVICRKERHKLV